MFFHKEPSPAEVLNDLDGEIVNFFRVCQHHHEELLRHLAFAVHSRQWRHLHERQDPTLLTDVQRAARFLYLQRTAWGGRMDGTYGAFTTGSARLGRTFLAKRIEQVAHRLERVQLEQLPYGEVLQRYDRTDTLFYLDPPYVGLPYYRFNFTDEDFAALAERLSTLKGRFLLSINDHAIARKVFARFRMETVAVCYSVTAQARHRHELLFTNCP